jgi:hypothetical protein
VESSEGRRQKVGGIGEQETTVQETRVHEGKRRGTRKEDDKAVGEGKRQEAKFARSKSYLDPTPWNITRISLEITNYSLMCTY